MGTLIWTVEAERWLRDIHEFIAADNPSAAAQTVQGIYDRAQVLIDFPRNIEILGVFHGALDISKYQL